jgi:hypothetical protein
LFKAPEHFISMRGVLLRGVFPLLGVFAYLEDPAGIHAFVQERLSSVLTMQTTLYRVKV